MTEILKQSPYHRDSERQFELMSDSELKKFKDFAYQCSNDKENLNQRTREECAEWNKLAKKELEYRGRAQRRHRQTEEYKKASGKKVKVPKGHRIHYEDDLVEVYDDKGKKVYSGLFDYCDYKDENYKWNETDKNYDLPHGYKLVGKTKH